MTPAESADRMRLLSMCQHASDVPRPVRQAIELLLDIATATGHGQAAEHYRFNLAQRFDDWIDEAEDAIVKAGDDCPRCAELSAEVEALEEKISELQVKN